MAEARHNCRGQNMVMLAAQGFVKGISDADMIKLAAQSNNCTLLELIALRSES